MEGAASAANSRSTSLAASRAQSPDLHASEHAHASSPECSIQRLPSDSTSPSELQSGHATAVHQKQSATASAAADCGSGQAASQTSSRHSSPVVSNHHPSIPSHTGTGAAAAEASPTSVTAAAAPLCPSEASAA